MDNEDAGHPEVELKEKSNEFHRKYFLHMKREAYTIKMRFKNYCLRRVTSKGIQFYFLFVI